jgi:hypothetical protein
MARNKNIERETQRRKRIEPPKKTALWRRPWVWIASAVGAVALFLTNVTSILADARGLPKEFRETSDQFFGWYGSYENWKGRWTYFPEGDIEMASMKLTEEPFQLVIDVTDQGEITGSIETRGICKNVPYFDSLMLSGSIKSGSRATIVLFDYVNGYRSNFAKLSLERDGGLMMAFM